MTTSTHRYHDYQLVLHHEGDDRYRITISIPRVIESPRPACTWSDRALLLGVELRRSPSRAAARHMKRDAHKVGHLSSSAALSQATA
jgi:hypothetical protein